MQSAAKLLVASFLLLGVVCAQKNETIYRVVSVNNDDTVESQINDIAAQGFEVQKFVVDPKFQYVIVFRRMAAGEQAPTYRIFSRTVTDGKTFKPPTAIEQPLSDVASGGYRVVPRSSALRGTQFVVLLKRDRDQWQYRLTQGKGKQLDRELSDLGKQGFEAVEYLPEKPFHSVLLEKKASFANGAQLRSADTSAPDELGRRLADFGKQGYRAAVVSDNFELVMKGGNAPASDSNVLIDGRAEDLDATLRSVAGKNLRLLPPLASNYDRRGVFRGMHHTVGGVFERSDGNYEYRVLQVSGLDRFSRDLNELQANGWELADLFSHWDPSDDKRMLAILERETPHTASK
jgi:hypothetical protein